MMNIIPVNEPNGEGNGWEPCDEALATLYEVDDGVDVVNVFHSRAQAEAYCKKVEDKND